MPRASDTKSERLIFQPDEVPTEPMAMPFGESTDVLELMLAGASSAARIVGAMSIRFGSWSNPVKVFRLVRLPSG